MSACSLGVPSLLFRLTMEKSSTTLLSALFCHTMAPFFYLTCPYTSWQNGRAECVLRTLNDCVRTLLFLMCRLVSGRTHSLLLHFSLTFALAAHGGTMHLTIFSLVRPHLMMACVFLGAFAILALRLRSSQTCTSFCRLHLHRLPVQLQGISVLRSRLPPCVHFSARLL